MTYRWTRIDTDYWAFGIGFGQILDETENVLTVNLIWRAIEITFPRKINWTDDENARY